MMLIYAYWIVVVVFAMKIVGNVVLPYKVLTLDDDQGVSIAFVLLGDLILSVIAVVISLAINEPRAPYETGTTLLLIGCAVAASYLHYFLVLSVAAAIDRRKDRSHDNTDADHR